MVAQQNQFVTDPAEARLKLNKRLEDIAWGVFLFMIGILLVLPDDQIPRGTWLIGAGLIMLSLNAIRYLNQIKISRFTLVLGIVATAVGLASIFGLKLPLFALFLIVVGAGIIFKSLFPGRD